MKKTLFIAAAALSMALGAQAEVKIGSKNTQSVTVKNGAVLNMANGNLAEAKQNLASNKGNVKIGGSNTQTVSVTNGAVLNMANGNMTKAEQNLASNEGK
jgi:uncharacterized protein YjlB